MAKKDKAKEDRQILPEPLRVPVLDGKADALIYPLGYRHITKFNAKITRMMMYLANTIKIDENASEDVMWKKVVMEATPLIMTDLLDLIEDCVRFNPNTVKMDDLPHWDLPQIIEDWLMESFGEPKKRDPWKRAIESTIVRFTGKEIDLKQIFSKGSSLLDGATKSSSKSSNPESPIEA